MKQSSLKRSMTEKSIHAGPRAIQQATKRQPVSLDSNFFFLLCYSFAQFFSIFYFCFSSVWTEIMKSEYKTSYMWESGCSIVFKKENDLKTIILYVAPKRSWREEGKEGAKANTRKKKRNKGDWFHGLDVLGCFSPLFSYARWRRRKDRTNIQIMVLQL